MINNKISANVLGIMKKEKAKIFFSGIGGISMSAIALALQSRGYDVSGSDIAVNDNTKRLEQNGIKIFYGHQGENLVGANLLVFNARIKKDNPERVYADINNIPCVSRAEMLGFLMQEYKRQIGIAGTHGKSSTTSMVSDIFMKAELNPTFFIGAIYPPINSAYKIGGNDYFILESDEYSDSFLNFYPEISVILNIEMDHSDYFADLNAVINSFKKYIANTEKYIIANFDDGNVKTAVRDCNFRGEIIWFSLSDKNADFYCENLVYNNGFASFDVVKKCEFVAHIDLKVPGEHNVKNAVAAVVSAYICGINPSTISESLSSFKGASRRFEYKGKFKDALVIDDYAHHPTEVDMLFDTAKKIAQKNIWCVFQPHTYSRVKELYSDYINVLNKFDNLIITDIYSANEKDTLEVSAEKMCSEIKNAKYISDFGKIAEYLNINVKADDIILAVGAGDINKLSSLLLGKL